ncbi:Fluoride-specific ion channel FluC OS=Streptomyces microflavus OX=1919 GN=fluC PE=3 SV=1 [Streptomyces microflavus]
MNWLLVVIGGAVGAPLRYLTDRAVQAHQGPGVAYVFPWGTFTANAAGSRDPDRGRGLLPGARPAGDGAVRGADDVLDVLLRDPAPGRDGPGLPRRGQRVASLLTGLGAVFLGAELAGGFGG